MYSSLYAEVQDVFYFSEFHFWILNKYDWVPHLAVKEPNSHFSVIANLLMTWSISDALTTVLQRSLFSCVMVQVLTPPQLALICVHFDK